MIAVVRFEPEAINPLAEKVWQSPGGNASHGSISATPKKDHWGDETKGENMSFISMNRNC
jgi:hypothetical protein